MNSIRLFCRLSSRERGLQLWGLIEECFVDPEVPGDVTLPALLGVFAACEMRHGGSATCNVAQGAPDASILAEDSVEMDFSEQ